MKELEVAIDEQGRIEVVFNACYGGFGISKEAIVRMIELGSEAAKECLEQSSKYGWGVKSFSPKVPRFDPILVQVVKELKNKASGECASLAIGKIDLFGLIDIDECDGKESPKRCYEQKVYGRYDKDE